MITANLMYLTNQKDTIGTEAKNNAAYCKMADDFILQAMNFPQSKAALCQVLKKLLMDVDRQKENTNRILKGKVYTKIT